MSKNTASSAFRKTNVDQYDEDNYEDEDVQAVDSVSSEIKSRIAEIKKQLAAGNKEDALKTALSFTPQLAKDKAAKDQYAATVMDVLLSFKVDEIPKVVVTLEQNQVDVLMKYIYRGMSNVPAEKSSEDEKEEFAKQCGYLLLFQTAATSACGLGSIVRVLSDRKTV